MNGCASLLIKVWSKVDKYSAYNWTQPEFDALVSFAYNIGSIDGLTAKGTRTRSEIAAKILEYNKAGGKVLSGLIRRRQEERKLFLTPVTVKTGWQQENGGWRFYKEDGSGEYACNKWEQDGDKWYWFNGAGSWSMTPGTSTKVLGITSLRRCHGKRLADDQWQVVLSGSGRPHGNGSGGTYS